MAHKKNERKQFSDLHVTYSILDCLILRYERREAGLSTYKIKDYVENDLGKTQRDQRIAHLLMGLETTGIVERHQFDKTRFWEITPFGYNWYKTTLKDVRERLGFL